MKKLFAAFVALMFAQAALAQGTLITNLPAATAPTKTYGVACQPAGGAAGTTQKCSPEQILSAGGSLIASSAGMVSGGADNAGNVAALNTLMSSWVSAGSVRFTRDPSIAGIPSVSSGVTTYYFSKPLDLARTGTVSCDGSGNGGYPGVDLVFAPGIDGVVLEGNTVTDTVTGLFTGSFENCGVKSLGYGTAVQTNGSGTIASVAMQNVDGITAPPFAAGDGIIALQFALHSTVAQPLAVPSGSYVGSVSGATLTLANGAVVTADTCSSYPNSGCASGGLILYRLPAALADTANTTAGSSTVTITGGTTRFLPGDLIWSSAFPWWTRVRSVSGAVGSQTLTMWDQFLSNIVVNATATTTGSYIWRVPAGVRRLATSITRNVMMEYWPIGLDMPCGSGLTPSLNCTSSKDFTDFSELNMVGRYTAGNNTGASTDYGSEFASNFYADIVEGGTVGSAYIGTNSNSGESQSYNPIIGNCTNANVSSFVGVYMGGGNANYCVTGSASRPLFLQPQAGSPLDSSSVSYTGLRAAANATYKIGGNYQATITAGTYDPSTGNVVLTVDRAVPWNVGDTVVLGNLTGFGNPRTNLGGSRIVQTGTTGTTLNLTIASGLSGLTISSGNVTWGSAPCSVLGYNYGAMAWTSNCATLNNLINLQYYTGQAVFNIANVTNAMRFTFSGYTGYQGANAGRGFAGFPSGILLNDIGSERLLSNTAVQPTNTWNLQGDVYLNRVLTAGGFMAWADTAAGTNFMPAAPVARDAGGVSWAFPELIATGAKPAFTGSGCTASSTLGGTSAGSFVTSAACAIASTITITFPVAAPNGWDCSAKDETAHVGESQSADTATTCTIYVSNATTAGDKIVWSARGY